MTDVTLDDNPVAALPLTGDEILAGIQDDADVQMTVDDILAPAVRTTGNQTIEGTKSFADPVVVPTPTAANHAVPRSFVDALALGGAASSGAVATVKVVSTSPQNIGLASGLPVIDGYQTVENDRVLLTGQTSAVDDGPWVARGALGWVRPDDFAVGTSQAGMAVFVAGGNTYKGSVWVLNSTGTVLVGTNAQTWAQDATAVRLTGNQTIGGTKTFSNAPLVPDNSWSISDTAGLNAALAGKADDNDVVHDTGNEPIDGVKTFSSSPVVPTATTSGQAVNKGQMDTAVSGIAGTILAAAGGTDDTAAVVAGRTAAGAGGTLVFTSGTYVVTGLAASVANQHWIVRPGATIKLKNGSNTPVIDVTASGVTIDGGGTIDGNRANQTATAPLDAVQGNTAGIRAITVDKLKVKDLLIKDTGVGGVFADNVTNLQVRNNTFTGCGQSGNYKVVMVYFTVGSSTGVRISGNVIDGSLRGNGCIGISLNAASRVVSRIRITGNECIVGNAGVDATLGIELFTGSGAAIRDAVVANNVVVGTAGSAPFNVYGISVGGTTTGAALGCSNVSVTGNTVRDCNLAAIELCGSGVACTGNTTYNSGAISVAAAASMTGGLRASTVSGNTLLDTVGAAYAIYVSGNADGLNGVTVSGNVIHSPEGAGIKVDGLVTRLTVTGNVMTAGNGPGFYTDDSATVTTLTDSTVSGNTFDLTGSPADQDGILLASPGIEGLKIIGNTITGASRYGIYGLAATTAIEVIDNTITGCNQGLRTDDVATAWVVHGNHIHDNTDRGIIFFVAAVDLQIYGDTLYNNPGGDYYLTGSTFASFFVNGQAVTIP